MREEWLLFQQVPGGNSLGGNRIRDMGSKVLKQKLYEYEATLKHRDNQIKELQNVLNGKDLQIRQLLEMAREKGLKIEDLPSSVTDHPKERVAEPGVDDKENLVQPKEEEMNSLRLAVDEKQKEIERLSSAIEHERHEWEFKINEQKVQMNGIMAEKEARLKRLEELLRNRETELERHTTKDNYYKKQIEAKERLLKISRSAANEKEKEIDIFRKRLESKEQELKFIKEELKIEMSGLVTEKDDFIKKLEESLKAKQGELERKYSQEKESHKRMQVQEDELTTIRSAMNQKEQEVLELIKALQNKEQELRKIKSEMSSALPAAKRRLIVVKARNFWEAFKAFFRVRRAEHH
jgi:chromosome segregation ATPase